MLCQEVISTVDLAYSAAAISTSGQPEYVDDLQSRLFNCYLYARKYLKMAAESQKKNYETRTVENTYQVGDLVYQRNHHANSLRCPGLALMLFCKILGECFIKK